MTNQHY